MNHKMKYSLSKEQNKKQPKYKNDFNNVKSNFILKKIFDLMKKNKTLKIIKYNKKLHNRLKLDTKDYKECSLIQLEIKLDGKNKYGQFINIPEKDKDYYHIYFDNSKQEIKRNYLKEKDKVKTIKILIEYEVNSFKELFHNCNNISSIYFKNFLRNNITDMSDMFSGCSSLTSINLSNFNTNNVTNMSGMFGFCSSLKELNLSNFNTNKVTNMEFMFCRCSSLKELNLNNFNTNNVNNMSYMFYKCSKLKELNISNFNINNVIDKKGMFNGCSDDLIKKIKKQNKKLIV